MAQQMLPFRYNTRQRIQPIGSNPVTLSGNPALNVNAGTRLTYEVPRVGFLAGFFVVLLGGLTRGGADTGAFSQRKFNVLNRLQTNINIGAAAIDDISGYGLYLDNQARWENYSADLGGSATGNALFAVGTADNNEALCADPATWQGSDATPTVGGHEPFTMQWYVPVAANDGDNFNMGLINAQAPEVRVTLDIQVGQLADLFVAGSTLTNTQLTANLLVTYLYYEVPNPQQVMFPPLMMHRCLEERTPFSNTGDITYLVPRQGNLLKLIHNVIINGVNSGQHNLYVIRVNKTDDVYRESQDTNRFLSRTRYGHRTPTGSVFHDFWNSEGLPSSGDFRDVIDTEAISTLESVVNINPGAVLGIGNNFLDTEREIIQVLQV